MSFISTQFAFFLAALFLVYWGISRFGPRWQNPLLLAASYYFYGTWSWKFLLLLAGISLFNYLAAISIGRCERKPVRRALLLAGLVVNIANLVIFKYFNFFVDEFIALFSFLGITLHKVSLTLIIPLGISFYTFLAISYLMDVYRRTVPPDRDLVNVLLALGFFPIIVSGPIHRPGMLLPQIRTPRVFSYPDMVTGLRQILWGLFTKLVIADNLAPFADSVFSDPAGMEASAVLAGVLFYSVQIYADFSAYSDIAIGIGRLLGFSLMRNFRYPYFSASIADFWKRWHISLTTWFRDYLFLPVAWSVSKALKKEKVWFIRTDFIIYSAGIAVTWFITGIWHGANTTFLVWGLIHGCFLILYQLQKKPRKWLLNQLDIRHDNAIVVVADVLVTLGVVMMAWVFFRSDSIDKASLMIGKIFSFPALLFPVHLMEQGVNTILVMFFFMVEWNGSEWEFAVEKIGARWPKLLRWTLYSLFICFIFLFAKSETSAFLYFKF